MTKKKGKRLIKNITIESSLVTLKHYLTLNVNQHIRKNLKSDCEIGTLISSPAM
jgi:hypothetical protein